MFKKGIKKDHPEGWSKSVGKKTSVFAHGVVYCRATYREFLGYLLIANSVHLGTPEDSPVTLAVDVLIDDAIDLAVGGRMASLLCAVRQFIDFAFGLLLFQTQHTLDQLRELHACPVQVL